MTRIRMKKRTSLAHQTMKLPVIVKLVECWHTVAKVIVHGVESAAACNGVQYCSSVKVL